MKEKKERKKYSVKEVAAMYNCDLSTLQKWAKANDVKYIGEGRRKDYKFTKADIERFKNRPKPGRRWPESPEIENNR